jgi:two-component system, OmpR family, sensor histidine kinase KdpD
MPSEDEQQERRSPEEFLGMAKKEEAAQRPGKLKIFLGMAAGVGKTYSMLEAAQKLKKEGVDLVIGVVDTHGRIETAKLMEGLEQIPQKPVLYHHTEFQEMDLDAILKRKPQLVMVDELAHQNIPGSRHPKRWQDVIEILDHGISVYTTLNVQHIESLKDMVERIAGISIRETVPDLLIDRAESIELVDLTPAELRQRLKEGKVYLGTQSTIAAENFFQEDKLTALREIILRYSAEKVDHELRGMYSTAHWIDGWKPRERLLVAVSHSPHSQKLIRITRRLAFNLDAPWIAVHVNDGRNLDQEEKGSLSKNLALARDLGAEVIMTSGPDLAEAIKRISRQKSVTQIIIGRSPRRWFGDFFQFNTLLKNLARECSDIDLHVIRQTMPAKSRGFKLKFFRMREPFSSYIMISLFVLLLTGFNLSFLEYVGYRVAGFSFLLAILISSLFFRIGPILFASVLYALIWSFVFLPAKGAELGWNEDAAILACYLFTAVFNGILTNRAKKNKAILIKHERSIEALYEILHEMSTSYSFEHALVSVKNRLHSVLDLKCEILLKQPDREMEFEKHSLLINNEKEKAAANWVFENGKEAGWSTSTLPYSENLYIPIKLNQDVLGLLIFHSRPGTVISLDKKNLIYSVAQLLATFYERHLKAERDKRIEEHKKIEKTYESTLGLIANLFEGPLLTIQDAVKELKKKEEQVPENALNSPLERIGVSADSLRRILENISAMVHLNAGLTPINLKPHNIKKLILTCCEILQKNLPMFRWTVEIEKKLPELICDYDLIELLFYNMVFHAVEFSPPDSTIKILAMQTKHAVAITVAGEGSVVPEEMLETLFEKFYRRPDTTQSGLGLGLAIAKVIAEIHHGHLEVKSRAGGGLEFSLSLPSEIFYQKELRNYGEHRE